MTGNQLKEEIRKLAITQEVAAKRLGITLRTLQNWFKLSELDANISQNVKSKLKIGDEGSMLQGVDAPAIKSDTVYVPLLPVSAQGGSLDDFVVSIKDSDCEKIISPIKGADFAMTVSGDSMAPEYPSGSKILIKKINERSFIEWGRCYVLDTCNGTVIKKLDAPTEHDEQYGIDYVTCVSVNPNPIYKPFRVPTKDIYGMYRVLLLLTEK